MKGRAARRRLKPAWLTALVVEGRRTSWRSARLAMQKVEGSSPFIRLGTEPNERFPPLARAPHVPQTLTALRDWRPSGLRHLSQRPGHRELRRMFPLTSLKVSSVTVYLLNGCFLMLSAVILSLP